MSTDRPHDTIADIETAVADLTDRDHLYTRLHQLIPQQGSILRSQIGSHARYSASPIPWNSPAAMLYFDIHAAVREHESNLTLLLWQTAKFRGGTDELTTQAIRRIPDLIRAAHIAGHAHHTVVVEATRAIVNWPVRIRRVLDESRPHEVPWTKAPGNLRCPECSQSLHLVPGWQYDPENAAVICRHCTTDDGQPLTWEPSAWLAKLQDTPDVEETPKPVDPDRQVTAREAVILWGLSADQVYVWEHRGRITAAGTDSDGRKTYRAGDITTLRQANAAA